MKVFFHLVIFIYLINPIFPTTHFDKSEKFVYISNDLAEKPVVISNTNEELAEVVHQRFRRDATSSDRYENNKNISVKVKIVKNHQWSMDSSSYQNLTDYFTLCDLLECFEKYE
jgi:hypothetical protein